MGRAEGRQLDELEDQLQGALACVLDGSPTGPALFAEVVVAEYATRGSLIQGLTSAGIGLDEARDELVSIVGRFVAEFLKAPSKYRPDKAPLGAYIQMALMGDVLNEAERIRKLAARQAVIEDTDVGDLVDRRNPQLTPEDEVMERVLDLSEEELERARRFIASLAPDERICLELMDEGIRANEVYAEQLGLSHLPLRAQREAVNRLKDRLKKRTARLR